MQLLEVEVIYTADGSEYDRPEEAGFATFSLCVYLWFNQEKNLHDKNSMSAR